MRVYLAGPINGCTDAEAKDWRTDAKRLFPDHRDPMDRDCRGRESEPGIAEWIVLGDKRDILACDVLLVYYERPSVGTSMEVMWANQQHIPVVIVNRSGGDLSPWLVYHADEVFSSLAEAAKRIGRRTR